MNPYLPTRDGSMPLPVDLRNDLIDLSNFAKALLNGLPESFDTEQNLAHSNRMLGTIKLFQDNESPSSAEYVQVITELLVDVLKQFELTPEEEKHYRQMCTRLVDHIEANATPEHQACVTRYKLALKPFAINQEGYILTVLCESETLMEYWRNDYASQHKAFFKNLFGLSK